MNYILRWLTGLNGRIGEHDSYDFVGPFASPEDAFEWAVRDQAARGDNPCWMRLDLASAPGVPTIISPAADPDPTEAE